MNSVRVDDLTAQLPSIAHSGPKKLYNYRINFLPCQINFSGVLNLFTSTGCLGELVHGGVCNSSVSNVGRIFFSQFLVVCLQLRAFRVRKIPWKRVCVR